MEKGVYRTVWVAGFNSIVPLKCSYRDGHGYIMTQRDMVAGFNSIVPLKCSYRDGHGYIMTQRDMIQAAGNCNPNDAIKQHTRDSNIQWLLAYFEIWSWDSVEHLECN
ncbi:UNVERIFIED_CONTAM: hypothetical protein FKN15_042627 [Acipenser sinensis]